MSSDLFARIDDVRRADIDRNEIPENRLSAEAVGHLAHDMRGSLHTILGHAELLALDATDQNARDSASYIRDATERLRGLCDDITDLLRLPGLPDRGSVPLSAEALVESVRPVATAHGSHVRLLQSSDDGNPVAIDATSKRVISHVLAHVVRMTRSEVTFSASVPTSGDMCVITVAPVPEGMGEELDGVLAIAGRLLAARGAALDIVGSRLEMVLPVVR